MSCDAMVVTGNDVVNHIDVEANELDGWIAASAVSTAVLAQFYGIIEEVLEFKGFFDVDAGLYGQLEIVGIEVMETAAAAGNLQEPDLLIQLWKADQTAPTDAAVYADGDESEHLVTVEVPNTAWEFVNETTRKARISLSWFVTNGSYTTGSLFLTALANAAETMHASSGLKFRPIAKRHA